mgnify:CR=1 FL=1|jgi:hypothetical protein
MLRPSQVRNKAATDPEIVDETLEHAIDELESSADDMTEDEERYYRTGFIDGLKRAREILRSASNQ